MSIHMAKTIKEERLRWILPIVKQEVKLKEAAKVCPHSKRSLERWVALYKEEGEAGLEPKSTEPKTQEKETPIWVKERIVEIRKKTKKCALKIHWQLEKEGIVIHERTIGKILKKEGLVRKYRVRKIKYKYIRALRQPGELVEIDVKYVPGRIKNKRYYQYTAVDTASRRRHLAVYDEQTNFHSVLFLREVMEKFEHKIQAVKTDNGSLFTNYYTSMTKRSDMTVKTIHALEICCRQTKNPQYQIQPVNQPESGIIEG